MRAIAPICNGAMARRGRDMPGPGIAQFEVRNESVQVWSYAADTVQA